MSIITKTFTFSAGATIIASEHNTNFDTIYNDYNGNITNANCSASMDLDNSKINLTTITQPVTIQDDVTLGGGAGDNLIINMNDGITYTPAATWTFTGNQTVSGTWADLGSATTIDINGGTLDDVQIDGADAHGDIWYNDGSNNVTKLDTGTSGFFLKTNGDGSAPAWSNVNNFSNVIFQYVGNTSSQGNTNGEVIGTTLVPNGVTGNYRFFQTESTSLVTRIIGRWTKIAGVSTVTIHANIWARAAATSTLDVDIGGQSGDVTSTATLPAFATTDTIDVSSLSDGTTFDITVKMKTSAAGVEVFCGHLALMGS